LINSSLIFKGMSEIRCDTVSLDNRTNSHSKDSTIVYDFPALATLKPILHDASTAIILIPENEVIWLLLADNHTVFFGNIPKASFLNLHAWFQNDA
jgi:hypothetical protein